MTILVFHKESNAPIIGEDNKPLKFNDFESLLAFFDKHDYSLSLMNEFLRFKVINDL